MGESAIADLLKQMEDQRKKALKQMEDQRKKDAKARNAAVKAQAEHFEKMLANQSKMFLQVIEKMNQKIEDSSVVHVDNDASTVIARSSTVSRHDRIMDSIAKSISNKFIYDPENNITFTDLHEPFYLHGLVEKTTVSSSSNDPVKITIDQLVTESQRFVSLRSDNREIESHAAPQIVHAVQGSFKSKKNHSPKKNDNKPSKPCWLCGGEHYIKVCSYKTHVCSSCSRTGHKQGFCDSSNPSNNNNKNVNKPEKNHQRSNAVNSDTPNDRKFVRIQINGKTVKMQLDSASDPTIITYQTWRYLGSPKLSASDQKTLSVSGDPLNVIGHFLPSVTHSKSSREVLIHVVSNTSLNVIGINLINKFGWWDVLFNSIASKQLKTVPSSSTGEVSDNLQKEFPEVFSDKLGRCSESKPKLMLKPDAKPVFRDKRPVPFAVAPLLDDALSGFESQGVLQKNDSTWAAPIVAVRKPNGDLQVCANFSTGLNDALESHHHPLHTADEIESKLAGNKFFSHIDLSNAYFQIEVDDDSENTLTINTHRGLNRFNRLPQGAKPSTGIFQQIIDAMLSGIDGVSTYLDDIICGGNTQDEYLHRTRQVLSKLREYDFTVKINECKFLLPELKFLGKILDSNGQRPDPEKILAIEQLPPPENLNQLRSYLGAINWYRKFIPNMSSLQAPLDKLLKKDAAFDWTPECQKSFEEFKRILTSDLTLTHYDPALPIIVSADASSVGIGATICHRMTDNKIKVVQYASRALTKAEQGYSQIEREALDLIYAVTKFQKFI